MSQHFDVIVMGVDTAGLIAAGLLAKRGLRILIVEQHKQPHHYSHAGYLLPTKPQVLPHLEHSAIFKTVHQELGLGPVIRANTEAVHSDWQAVFPKHRLNISHEHFLKEIQYEFKDLKISFMETLKKVDAELTLFLQQHPPFLPQGFFERFFKRSLFSALKHTELPFLDTLQNLPKDHALALLFTNPLPFLTHLQSFSTFQVVRVFMRYLYGMSVFREPLLTLDDLLRKNLREQGVEIIIDSKITKVHTVGRKIVHVQLNDVHKIYTATFFVHNTSLPIPTFKIDLQHLPISNLSTFNYVVKKDILPKAMQPHLLLTEHEELPLWLERSKAVFAEHSTIDTQHEILSVFCAQPLKASEVLKRVGKLIPFFEDFIVDSSTPDSKKYASHPIFSSEKAFPFGISLNSIRTEYKNVWHAGCDVIPGLGIEGEYITGLAIADIITKYSKIKK